MQRYGNISGTSGVVAYEIARDAITIEFVDGGTYRYTNRSAGSAAVATMKQLAKAGSGLSTYISRRVREDFSEKLR